jgi:hypothetical protein
MNAPITLKPEVRVAVPDDEREIYRLLMLANAENAIMESNSARVMFFTQRFLYGALLQDEGPRGCFGVIGASPGGKLEGVCMIAIGQFWYTLQQHLEEYLVFVDPEFRKGNFRHGIALIDWAKEQVRKTGLPLITGILSNHRTEAKCKLYRRHLPKIGEYFFFDGDKVPHFHADKLSGPGSMVVGASSMAA